MSITFEKANTQHIDTIFAWLAEPHMQEFWDNSQEHKDDILNFIDGRKEPSNYFDGIFTYWVESIDDQLYCFGLTAQVTKDDKLPQIWRENISKLGNTYSIDFGIGNKEFLGKGLASATLEFFVKFFREKIDPRAETFFIDPDDNNPRAQHVYNKAGFRKVGDFVMEPRYHEFSGNMTHLMVKKLPLEPLLVQATLEDYHAIQNMAKFYEYEMSRYCGWPWEGEDGGYPSAFLITNFKKYFKEKDRYPFLIKIDNELAGFVLVNKIGSTADVDWNIGEFFILAKFQGTGIGKQVAFKIFDKFPGKWETEAMPDNTKAIGFWRKTVNEYTHGNYTEGKKMIGPTEYHPESYPMVVYGFETNKTAKYQDFHP